MLRLLIALVGIMLVITGCESNYQNTSETPREEVVEKNENTGVETSNTETESSQYKWMTDFSEKGFTQEEIMQYKDILTNVGITDYHDIDILENGRMHIIRGKIFDSDKLQLNVTLEDRKIIVVTLAGIPDYDYKPYITIFGNLKFRKVNTTTEVDLYYDVDGGYVAKLDWENKEVIPYAAN